MRGGPEALSWRSSCQAASGSVNTGAPGCAAERRCQEADRRRDGDSGLAAPARGRAVVGCRALSRRIDGQGQHQQ